jgi:hypothetical protein
MSAVALELTIPKFEIDSAGDRLRCDGLSYFSVGKGREIRTWSSDTPPHFLHFM